MSGLYLINKPIGITSHDVVDYLRKITGERTIGHAGTLDPLASGLMIIAIGREFTRKISVFSKLDKGYTAEATLGATSTTYDSEGAIAPVRHPDFPPAGGSGYLAKIPRQDDIEIVLQDFLGEQNQVPPIYSAKKIGGKKAYDLARQGKIADLKPISVTISEIELLDYQYPKLKFRAKVSSGTYIRSLVNDIGRKLGTGAYMSGLIRNSIGEYKLAQAIDLDQIKSVSNLESVKIA